MKRIFIIFLILIFICIIITGCDNYRESKRSGYGKIIVDKLYEYIPSIGLWFSLVVVDDKGNHSIIYNIDIDTYYSYNINDIYMGD